MTRDLFTARPTATWPQVFLGLSIVFMWGAVAFVIFRPAGIVIWTFAGIILARRIRVEREDRAARAATQQQQETWNDRWASWGGRPPEHI